MLRLRLFRILLPALLLLLGGVVVYNLRPPGTAHTPQLAADETPTAEMLAGLGHEVSALGVARLYRVVARAFILDRQDEGLASGVRELGLKPVVTDTVMRDAPVKEALARAALEALG